MSVFTIIGFNLELCIILDYKLFEDLSYFVICVATTETCSMGDIVESKLISTRKKTFILFNTAPFAM